MAADTLWAAKSAGGRADHDIKGYIGHHGIYRGTTSPPAHRGTPIRTISRRGTRGSA